MMYLVVERWIKTNEAGHIPQKGECKMEKRYFEKRTKKGFTFTQWYKNEYGEVWTEDIGNDPDMAEETAIGYHEYCMDGGFKEVYDDSINEEIERTVKRTFEKGNRGSLT